MPKSHRICMISDYFFPNMGGVETHIWCLSQSLLQLGHKVIVITHKYGSRQGVRYMTNGLKVYYLPLSAFYDQVTLPTLISFFSLFRNILLRENITIVHGHQSTSTLTNEGILFARTMGYKICYTDHSLFGFDEISSIHMNKILTITLSDVDQAICVSNICKENLTLRARLHPSRISTIPNAVDPTRFTPDPSLRSPVNTVNIVLLSRLVYRKGIDLACKIIPLICAKFPLAYFIIGGDGPKRLALEEMREAYQLHDRVELLGAVPHNKVREAASCGLFVVSTRVGGVPEVLPPSMIKFADPTVLDLLEGLSEAVSMAKRIVPNELHARMVTMYDWTDVAKRTVLVYNDVMTRGKVSLGHRLSRHMNVGPFSGILAAMVVAFLHIVWRINEMLYPESNIEMAPDLESVAVDDCDRDQAAAARSFSF